MTSKEKGNFAEDIVKWLVRVLRIPPHLPKRVQFKNVSILIPLIAQVPLGIAQLTAALLAPFVLPNFARDSSGNVSWEYWLTCGIISLCFLLISVILVLGILLKTTKQWVMWTNIISGAVLVTPLCLLFKGVFGSYRFSYVVYAFNVIGLASADNLALKRKFSTFFVVLFLIYCFLVPCVAMALDIIGTVERGVGQGRTFVEEIVKVVAECVFGLNVVFLYVVNQFFSSKKNFEGYRKRILDFNSFLGKKDKSTMEEEMKQVERQVMKSDYFSSELDEIFSEILNVALHMKSFLPEFLSPTSPEDDGELGEEGGSNTSEEDISLDFGVSCQVMEVMMVCVTFEDFLDIHEIHSLERNVGTHSKILAITESLAENYKGNLSKYDHNTFLAEFHSEGHSIKFAQSVKRMINKMNEEFLSDTLSFIRAGISIVKGKMASGILGHKRRRVKVLFGKAKRVAKILSEYVLSIKERTNIVVGGSVDFKSISRNVHLEPSDLILIPNKAGESKEEELVKVFGVHEKRDSYDMGEHSWMINMDKDKVANSLRAALDAILKDDASLAVRMFDETFMHSKKEKSVVYLVAKKLQSDGKKFTDVLDSVRTKIKYPATQFESVFQNVFRK